MGDMSLKAIFTLIDKVTAPVKKISGSVKELNNDFKKTGDTSNQSGKKVGGLVNWIKNLGGETKKTRKELDNLQKSGTNSLKLLGKSAKISGLVFSAAITSALALVTSLAGGMWEVSSKFEKYEATLTTLYGGNQAKAKTAMAWIKNFSKDAPFAIDEVTDAFIKLNDYGINAMDGTLNTLGDWAAGSQKSLDQVVEALAGARRGEFDKLNDLGIVAQKAGKQILLTYDINGKKFKKLIKNDAEEIQKALLDIGNTKFTGGMIRQQKSAEGILKGLSKWFYLFKGQIGDAGIFEHVKNRIASFLDSLTSKEGQAKVSQWAKALSDSMIKLFDAVDKLVSSADWPTLIDNLTKFVTWVTDAIPKITSFIDAMGGFSGIFNMAIAFSIFRIVTGLYQFAVAMGVVTAASGPIGLIVIAIAALAAGAFLVWKNWDKVKVWLTNLWSGLVGIFNSSIDWIVGKISDLWNWYKGLPLWAQALISLPATILANLDTITSAVTGVIDAAWNMAPDWFKGMVKGTLKLIAPSINWDHAPNPPQAAVGNNNSSHNVTLTVPANANANVTKSSGNASLVIKRPLGIQGGGNGR